MRFERNKKMWKVDVITSKKGKISVARLPWKEENKMELIATHHAHLHFLCGGDGFFSHHLIVYSNHEKVIF
jgi:hypothetical protein